MEETRTKRNLKTRENFDEAKVRLWGKVENRLEKEWY